MSKLTRQLTTLARQGGGSFKTVADRSKLATVATHMMKSPERNLYVVKRLLGHVSLVSTLEYIDENVDGLRNILETELM